MHVLCHGVSTICHFAHVKSCSVLEKTVACKSGSGGKKLHTSIYSKITSEWRKVNPQ